MRWWLILMTIVCWPASVLAIESTNYKIPQFQLPQLSNRLNSTTYILDATGAPIVGVASSLNYGLDIGFPSITGGTITLSIDSSIVDLGRLSPGTPVTGTSE